MNRLAIFDCDGTLVDSQHSEQVRSAIGKVRTSPGRSQPCPGDTAASPICAAMSGGHGDLLACLAMERCFGLEPRRP